MYHVHDDSDSHVIQNIYIYIKKVLEKDEASPQDLASPMTSVKRDCLFNIINVSSVSTGPPDLWQF